MVRNSTRFLPRYVWVTGLLLLAVPACFSPGQRAALVKQRDTLRRDKARLDRTVAQRDGTIASLRRQIEDLQRLGPDRPVGLFAPVSLEIAGLSGGADYDDKPGDDGVTVYLRPFDADGDVVKVPGRITIQLLDNTNLASPRVLGVFVFDDLDQLRRFWHGRFATQHFTLKCPFPAGAKLPDTRRVTISAEFLDFLTGATLTAVKEVSITVPND